MADNVAVTAGSGTTIATDQGAGGEHYQKVKLVDGTADSTTVVGVDIGVKANALRTAPASDITDATYIGDIKFGESLPAGTAAIGKLSANSGVDIGDVDVTSIAAGDNNIGNVDLASAIPAGTGGLNTIGKTAPDDYELAGNTLHVKKYYTNAGAATDGIVWSPAAGKRWYVTDMIINVSAAATVTLEDDLAGGDSPVFKAELAANGGVVCNFKTPLYSGEDAADLLVTTSAGNVYITVTGYEV